MIVKLNLHDSSPGLTSSVKTTIAGMHSQRSVHLCAEVKSGFLARRKDTYAWLSWALCCWTDLSTTIALRRVNTRCEHSHLAAKLTQLLDRIGEPYLHTRDVAEWTGFHKDSNLWMCRVVQVSSQNASCNCLVLAQSMFENPRLEERVRHSTGTRAHDCTTMMHRVC